MPALSNEILYTKLKAALPNGSQVESEAGMVKPMKVLIPKLGRVRVYLWTVTPDRSREGARPPGEHKMQLILPNQPRGQRGSLPPGPDPVILLGLSPEYGVFVGWEARLYETFAYSANVQVREEILEEARSYGWAIAEPRRKGKAEEVRVAFTPGNLERYIQAAREADRRGLSGKIREAFFITRIDPGARLPEKASGKVIERLVQETRRRISATRLARDSKFGPAVRAEYDYSCALCGMQLEIVEAAHIIPVHEATSSDQVWNGIAMCPNHHRLFDARSYVILPTLRVKVDRPTVDYLVSNGRASGLEWLEKHDGVNVRQPFFWDRRPAFKDRMQEALSARCASAAVA